ncbi:uncharacterized protein LOC143899135 [Temnothorax americanus]|uniref:uncharacterized protein LOC143899135 n=1 Tax=Temnothorax americanus TaxID=1964332 RepID=UPI0040695107
MDRELTDDSDYFSDEDNNHEDFIDRIVLNLRVVPDLHENNVRDERLRDVRQITPVQFLRDRELGIRGTSERFARQGIVIETESPYDWNVRQKVYQRLLDECVSEEERCADVPYYFKPRYWDYHFWAIEIFRKIEDGGCEALYIKIHTGIGNVSTGNRELFHASDLREWYERHVIEPTLSRLEEFQERDSGWALSRILNLTVNVNKYNPLRAGCYINLPQKIKSKKAVINVQLMDNACFAWSVVAALHLAERHSERESSYPDYKNILNLQGIEFPMTLKQIKKFERLNDISINVYTIEGEKTPTVRPIRFTDRKKEKHVNLLYVQDPRDDVGHFAWIKNLSRLVSSQLSRYNGRKYICDR